MKRVILIVAVLVVCICQICAQNMSSDTVQISQCSNKLPYIFKCPFNDSTIETIECDTAGLYYFGICGSSVLYVNLTVIDNHVQEEPKTLCQNKMLHFYDSTINGANYPLGYTKLEAKAFGYGTDCDTIMILHLTVAQVYNHTIEDQICVDTPYLKNGFYIAPHTIEGTYYYNDSLKTKCCGCDSIVELILIVNPKKEVKIYAEICEGDIYSDNNFNATKSGKYTNYNYGGSADGCDSTTILYLTVHSFRDTVKVNVCENDFPYYYTKRNGQILKFDSEGIYCVDTLYAYFTGAFCDSVIYLEINNEFHWMQYKYVTICQNETLIFYGNSVNEDKDHSLGNDTLYFYVPSYDPYICDTLMKLVLTVLPVYNDTIPAEICFGGEYHDFGFHITEDDYITTGISHYTHEPPLQTYPVHTYQGYRSCDSIVTLKLTVHPKVLIEISETICIGDSIEFFGEILTETKTYTNIGFTEHGCEYKTELTLTVLNPVDTLEISDVCANALPYYYHRPSDNLRFEFHTAGVYPIDTIAGMICDSIFYVKLDVIDNPQWNAYKNLCQNKILHFKNKIFYGVDYPVGDTTIIHFIVPSVNQDICDTLMILHLFIEQVYNDTIKAEICAGEDYFDYTNGFFFVENKIPGVFYDSLYLNTKDGCDSIVTLQLTVHPHKDSIIIAEICAGDIYQENGFNIDEILPPGKYIIKDTVTNGRCTYNITLNLTVLENLKMKTLPFEDEICADYDDFPIKYNVLAGKIDTVFITFDKKAQDAGFKDFVKDNSNIDNIKISLPQDIHPDSYVTPDNYSVKLYFKGRCSDTTVIVNFTVLYPSWVMEQRWNDVIVLKNAAYNGGYDFSYYQWLGKDYRPIDKEYIQGNYIYTYPKLLWEVSTEYRVLLKRTGQSQSFCSCPLIFNQKSPIYDYPIFLTSGGKITVKSKEPIVEWHLFNILGQTLRSGRYANTEIEINVNPGIYIIRLTTNKGETFTNKIIVPQ